MTYQYSIFTFTISFNTKFDRLNNQSRAVVSRNNFAVRTSSFHLMDAWLIRCLATISWFAARWKTCDFPSFLPPPRLHMTTIMTPVNSRFKGNQWVVGIFSGIAYHLSKSSRSKILPNHNSVLVMQSSSSNIVSNNWEEVDRKEITGLVTETNGRKENVLLVKEVSWNILRVVKWMFYMPYFTGTFFYTDFSMYKS